MRRALFLNTVIAATYAAVGVASLSLSLLAVAAPMWPPAGLAVAVTLRWRARVLPGVFLGSFITNLVVLAIRGSQVERPMLFASALGAGAVLQAFVGAAMVRGILARVSALTRASDIFLFLFLAGPVAAIIGATVGTATQLAAGLVSPSDALSAWIVWWAGDAMGVLIFGPIAMMLLPDRRRTWQGWRLKVAIPSLVFATILTGALMVSENAAQARQQAERGRVAEEASARLVNQLDRQQEVLQGIKGLVQASDEVDAGEFRTYTTDSLQRFPTLKALSWNPALSSDELDVFIAERRQQPDTPDFTVTERDDAGELRPVERGRERYVVVEYIEPIAENTAALGYDIGSNPARAQAILEATKSGQMIGTPPIDLVQSNGDSQKGMLVLNPVYWTEQTPSTTKERLEELRGFSVGVYQLNDLLNEVFSSQFERNTWDDFSIQLFDITIPAEPVQIADRSMTPPPPGALTVYSEPMKVNGRVWQFAITATSGPLATSVDPSTELLLLAAVIGVYLLESLLLLLTARERQASSEALRQAHDANHDALTGLLNRRGFVAELEKSCAEELPGDKTHVLLFCDLDNFKQVNDEAGHSAGDNMLTGVATTIKDHVRATDIVGRMGGDEFAVILRNCSVKEALRIADTLTEAVTSFRLHTWKGEFGVGVSIGATPVGNGLVDASDAIHEADIAAYEAKANAGSAVCVRW